MSRKQTIFIEGKSLAEWAKEMNLSYHTAYQRHKKNQLITHIKTNDLKDSDRNGTNSQTNGTQPARGERLWSYVSSPVFEVVCKKCGTRVNTDKQAILPQIKISKTDATNLTDEKLAAVFAQQGCPFCNNKARTRSK